MSFKNTALVLIDVQQAFYDVEYWGGERNNPSAEKNCGLLLSKFRENGLPIFHVKHNSTNPNSPLVKGKPGNLFKPEVVPLASEIVIEKTVNSAFIGTSLEEMLRNNNLNHILVAGFTTDHCVSTSVRMGANLGFEVTLIIDACATFAKVGYGGVRFDAELIHNTAVASLRHEFANVVNTHEIIDNK